MLKRTATRAVPHVTECQALFHNAFRPSVKLPMDQPRPSIGTKGLSAMESAKKQAAAASSSSSNSNNTAPASSKPKHTLVLDIDETLIHTINMRDTPITKFGKSNQPKGFEDIAELIELSESKEAKESGMGQFVNHASYMTFLTRPYLQEFLEEVTDLFEVVFWTAGTAPYMAGILNGLERQVLQHMLAGKGCSYNNTIEGGSNASPLSSSTIAENTSYLFDFRKNMLGLAGPNGTAYASVVNTVANNSVDTIAKQGPLMNYYGYSRGQTLGQNYLKHLPLLGRRGRESAADSAAAESIGLPPKNFGNGSMSYAAFDPTKSSADNVIMMDDAVRSFVFTPRSAILVDQFKQKSINEVCNDTFLRDVMPMLRSVAKADCATVELDHWRKADYTKFDDMDMSMSRNAMASPSSFLSKTETHIGSFLTERRGCGTPITDFKPFGAKYDASIKAAIDAEVLHLQGTCSATESGFMHLFREQPAM